MTKLDVVAVLAAIMVGSCCGATMAEDIFPAAEAEAWAGLNRKRVVFPPAPAAPELAVFGTACVGALGTIIVLC